MSASQTDAISARLLGRIVLEAARVLLPPDRLSVSEAAARYRYLNNPGAYVGPWRNEQTPQLVEPDRKSVV